MLCLKWNQFLNTLGIRLTELDVNLFGGGGGQAGGNHGFPGCPLSPRRFFGPWVIWICSPTYPIHEAS